MQAVPAGRRVCQHEGCDILLPKSAPTIRKYCADHQRTVSRAQRHRQYQRNAKRVTINRAELKRAYRIVALLAADMELGARRDGMRARPCWSSPFSEWLHDVRDVETILRKCVKEGFGRQADGRASYEEEG